MTNQELARRADMALSALSGGTNGGLMSPEQSNAFIDMIMEQPTLLSTVRTIRMNAPTRKVNRIGFSTRILTAATQSGSAADNGTNARYVAAASRAAPSTGQITLNTKEVIAEIRLPYEVLEDNIEGQSLESHIIRLIAQRAAIDLEELALAGDSTLAGSDAYLGLCEGFLKRVTGSNGQGALMDNGNAGVSPDLFVGGMLAMPQKYLRNLNDLKHYVSTANLIRYRSAVASRATGYGDSMLTTAAPVYAGGVEVLAAPMLSGSGVAASNHSTKGLFTFPQNLLFGIQRDVQIETDKDIRSREIIIVLTARVDFQIDDIAAVVKYVNI